MWHCDVHVFPRFTGDDLYRTRGEPVDMAEVERVAALLRAHYPEPNPRAGLATKQTAAGCLLFDTDGRL